MAEPAGDGADAERPGPLVRSAAREGGGVSGAEQRAAHDAGDATSVDGDERLGTRLPARRRLASRGATGAPIAPVERVSPARDTGRRRLLAAADAVVVVVASGALIAWSEPAALGFWTLFLAPAWLVVAKLHGLYDRDHRTLRHLTVDELASLLSWATVSTALTGLLLSAAAPSVVSASGLIAEWALVLMLAPAARGAARLLWRASTPPARVVIIGTGPLERVTRRKVDLFPDMHLDVAGSLDVSAVRLAGDDAAVDRIMRAPCGGALPERVILAEQELDETLLARLAAFCKARRVRLSVVPPVRGMFGTAVRLSHVADLPLIEYQTWDAARSSLALKRGIDVAVASVLLVVLAVPMALVALAVRLDTRGSAVFRQRRAGLRGEPFWILKFRTMVAEAPARLAEVVALDGLEEPMFKLHEDPRITRVGRVLRRLSLDELPQLVNVLRGEMSLVGPRPEQLELVDRYREEHRFRLEAKPGMTGPMQVFGRGRLQFDERLAVEREYIENQSLGRDLRILMMTVPVILSRRGAF
jgi:exopolysaccharide biosynthesis polyprenyl glycosylphosphotransferase